MSFFAGLGTGVGNELQAGQERTRKRVEEQLKEARSYVEVARKRQAAADQTRTQIMNASKSYGVSPDVLFSAYKDGHMDQLVSLYEKAAQTGQTVSPEILSSWYTVPASVEMDEETRNKEINKIFGVIDRGIADRGTVDDASAAELLFSALTGGGEKEVNRRLRGRTVDGYDAESLLNMGDPDPAQGAGGRVSPDAYNWLRDNDPSDKDKVDTQITAGDVRTAENIVEPFVGKVMGLYGGRFNTEQHKNWLTKIITKDVTDFVADTRISGGVAPRDVPDEFTSRYIREEGDTVYIATGKQDKDGNELWQPVDEVGTLAGSPVALDREVSEPAGEETPLPQQEKKQTDFPENVDGATYVRTNPRTGNPIYRHPTKGEKEVPADLLRGFVEEAPKEEPAASGVLGARSGMGHLKGYSE